MKHTELQNNVGSFACFFLHRRVMEQLSLKVFCCVFQIMRSKLSKIYSLLCKVEMKMGLNLRHEYLQNICMSVGVY